MSIQRAINLLLDAIEVLRAEARVLSEGVVPVPRRRGPGRKPKANGVDVKEAGRRLSAESRAKIGAASKARWDAKRQGEAAA